MSHSQSEPCFYRLLLISDFDFMQLIVEMIPDFMHYIEDRKPVRRESEKRKP